MESSLIIGIHPDTIRNSAFFNHASDALRAKGIEVRELDLLAQDALDQARSCDGVMWHWSHNPGDKQSARQILYTIEQIMKIPVWPDIASTWHFDDKVAQNYLLKAIGAPIPLTWVFWREKDALQWIESAPFPLVLKLAVGAGSSNVILVRNAKQARKLVLEMFRNGVFPMNWNEHQPRWRFPPKKRDLNRLGMQIKDGMRYFFTGKYPRVPSDLYWKPEFGYVYFQEYLAGNDFDTRVTIIGDRAFAFRRFNRMGDFRASGSGRINYDLDAIDRRCIEIAFKVSRQCGFRSMAYDFLMKDGQPVICELSYGFVTSAVYKCIGHWDSQLNWHEGQLWPEAAMMEDFLQVIQAAKQRRLENSK